MKEGRLHSAKKEKRDGRTGKIWLFLIKLVPIGKDPRLSWPAGIFANPRKKCLKLVFTMTYFMSQRF